MALERITITIPRDLLRAADRRAKAEDRSRSWIIADALRHALDSNDQAPQAEGRQQPARPSLSAARYETAPVRPMAVAEPTAAPYAEVRGLGESRSAQLERDLALTPEQRVREAEETARLGERHERPHRHRVLTFDRYEDFLDWQQLRRTHA